MERFRAFMAGALDVAKIFSMVTAVFAFCIGALQVYAFLSTRAGAAEVTVLQMLRVEDSKKTDYILQRVDTIGDQMNHLALTGRVNYVAPPPPPPPVPPDVLGPQLPVGKVKP
jgi:hypothetical protein